MNEFGLLGFPLTHSFSKGYFENKWKTEGIKNCSYELFSFANVDDFWEAIASRPYLKGFNVTIPHKQSIMPLLTGLHPTAQAVGAVNTVKRTASGWWGFNTDVIGFEESLRPLLKPEYQRALVLGTGGASKAVCFVLNKLGIESQLVSRSESVTAIPYSTIDISAFTIIINTTPLGMSPRIEDFPPIHYAALTPKHLVYDLVYNPTETLFLKKSAESGAVTKNGLEMLHLQADSAWQIWSLDEGLI